MSRIFITLGHSVSFCIEGDGTKKQMYIVRDRGADIPVRVFVGYATVKEFKALIDNMSRLMPHMEPEVEDITEEEIKAAFTDWPNNCRKLLMSEGKPYPRAFCNGCNKSIIGGHVCPWGEME